VKELINGLGSESRRLGAVKASKQRRNSLLEVTLGLIVLSNNLTTLDTLKPSKRLQLAR
jgi:hypothetical protein